MKPHPFCVSNSNFADLESRALPRTNFNAATEWAPRRMLTLEDEVGQVRPGYVKPGYIQPPVKFVHTETPDERAERLSQEKQAEINGEPYPLWMHAIVWGLVITGTVSLFALVVASLSATGN